MATQTKITDPTEAALSAIQEALNLTDSDLANSTAPPAGTAPGSASSSPTASADPTGDRDSMARLPEVSEAPAFGEVKVERPRDRVRRDAPAEPRRPAPGRAANDDRRAVGEILQALQVRPSRKPFVLAFLASVLWLGAFGFYAWRQWGGMWMPGDPIAPLLMKPEAGLIGFGALVPVMGFYVLAHLFSRAQEMRLVARSMTQVAIRLAEPEGVGSDAVVSLSQTVRREVAAMGDGIERALARAGELETLVHSEIATLERAYGENEIRIRALIDELVTQREAILSNAERVKASISGSHETLRDDLNSAATRISQAVGEAGARVTQSLGAKAEEITGALARTGDNMIEEISTRGGDLITRLTSTSEDVSTRLTAASQSVTDTLGSKAQEITSSSRRRARNSSKRLLRVAAMSAKPWNAPANS